MYHLVRVALHSADMKPAHLEQDLYQFGQTDIGHGRRKGAAPDTPENEINPGVVGRSIEAFEGLSENEMPHDVERGPVEPGLEVQSFVAVVAFLVKAPDQEVHVLDDVGLLLPHGRVREPVRQGTTEP